MPGIDIAKDPIGPTTMVVSRSRHVDIFLKITGTKQGVIKGESHDSTHKEEIEVISFVYSVTQPYDIASGLAAGKRRHGPVRIMMKSSTATPRLFNAVVTGEHLKEVVLTCRKAGKGQQDYLKWTLNTAMIAELKTGFLTPDDLIPTDELALVFSAIKLEYKVQNADGSLGGAVMGQDTLHTHA